MAAIGNAEGGDHQVLPTGLIVERRRAPGIPPAERDSGRRR
ncbi:MAG TPA: hypothetical protein VHT75_10920 [Acidimicrobiales bacterium]|nr:hypothetical protein [Acidimicrobiales bacterium]